MKRLFLFAPAVVAAAACSSGPETIQPGQWESTVQFTSIEVPGAPEAAVAPMRQALGQPRTQTECITPQQAANPTANMMNMPGGNCQNTENIFSGGVIRVRTTCQQPGVGPTQISLEGSFTATTMEARISSETQAPAAVTSGPRSMRMQGTMNSRRIGDCPGS